MQNEDNRPQILAGLHSDGRRQFLRTGASAIACVATGSFPGLVASSAFGQTTDKTLQSMAPDPKVYSIPSSSQPKPLNDLLKGKDFKENKVAFKVSSKTVGPKKFTTLTGVCVANTINWATYNNQPIVASYLSWYVYNIYWNPGAGLPTFIGYCPVNGSNPNFPVPDALRWQIIPIFGQHYWLGCDNPNWGKSTVPGPVGFMVNDDYLPDNVGSWQVELTGIA
jgi:hypothetical protein